MTSAQRTPTNSSSSRPEAATVTESRALVNASADHLVRAAEHLAKSPVDYVAGVNEAHKSVRRAYEAILAWHGAPVGDDESLANVARRAESAASMLRTSHKRALHLETLVATFTDNDGASITQRESATTGYYTARNTLSMVIGSLPDRVVTDAIPTLNHAESIRRGRDLPSMNTDALTSRRPVYPTTRRRTQPATD